MFRKFIKIGGFMLLIVFLVVSLTFTAMKYHNASCQNIKIDYQKEESIRVNKDDIINLVKQADSKIIGKKLNQINAVAIEKAVKKHNAILNAEVYKIVATTDSLTQKGILGVRIKHREPIARLLSNTENYYIDASGDKIPLSLDYTANVLAVTGVFNKKYAKEELLPFILYIENDKFWQAQVEQVHITENGHLLLTPLIGNHIIEFGKLENYKEKLRNMETFYKKVLVKNNWNKYNVISLKYSNQIIAKRR